jgi:hypothetical protein
MVEPETRKQKKELVFFKFLLSGSPGFEKREDSDAGKDPAKNPAIGSDQLRLCNLQGGLTVTGQKTYLRR